MTISDARPVPRSTADDSAWSAVAGLLARSAPGSQWLPDAAERAAMRTANDHLSTTDSPVYGVTSGFGPLVGYPGDPDPAAQATGLIAHLTVGQGTPLPRAVVRTMVWLRLTGMARGHSGADPATVARLADQWNRGFTPLVPADGSLSASGDLVPLAHAAAAAAGRERAVLPDGTVVAAADALRALGARPVRWDARTGLAFVNGTSAALALALHNHLDLAALALAGAAMTGRLVALLGAHRSPYSTQIAAVRGHRGHLGAAALIRDAAGDDPVNPARPLQEPYSLRCAPQVIGAVLDQLRLQSTVLVTEAEGCTDNPVVVDGTVWHGGNFHAAPVGLASEQHALCLHQLAFLVERQLALVLDPAHNNGLAPMLAAAPGRTSGFAGVQLAATSQLGAIRQRCLPASITAVPTNLGNQDHVPLALNSAVAVADMLERAWLIVGSLLLALTRLARLTDGARWDGPLWSRLADQHADLAKDRALAHEVAAAASTARQEFRPDLAVGGTR
ncbi:aromatic amino acid ammonia-lyase [Actinophytocola sediminis]